MEIFSGQMSNRARGQGKSGLGEITGFGKKVALPVRSERGVGRGARAVELHVGWTGLKATGQYSAGHGREGGWRSSDRSLSLSHLLITYLSIIYQSINQLPTYRETVGIPGYLKKWRERGPGSRTAPRKELAHKPLVFWRRQAEINRP